MQGYDIYEECTEDGSIPEKVLAYPRGEFERQIREPSYLPAAFEIRNPRKIEEERKDSEIEAALRKYSSSMSEMAANQVAHSRAVGGRRSNASPISSVPSPQGNVGWSQRMRPQSAHRTISKLGVPPAPPAPPPPTVPSRPVIPAHPPVTAPKIPRYPNMSAPQPGPPPIPMVDEVKAVKLAKGTGLPMRKELKEPRFREYFMSSGVLRWYSPLWKFKGDTRLFTKEWWDYLTLEYKRY